MKTDVILAGFGGQGMLLIGKLLSAAALEEGREVCWLPSYGPEMRGGTANVTVTISDDPIGSPVVSTPEAVVVMNQPSLEKFGPAVVPGGLLIINSSLIPVRADREDVEVVYLPANDLANSIGAKRSPNIVVLGAYVALTGNVYPESTRKQIEHQFAAKPKVIDINHQAFQLGYDAAVQYLEDERKPRPLHWSERNAPAGATRKES